MAPRIQIKPIGSFSFLLALHVLFLVSYAMLMPAFEGADEPEHLRYIEAVYNGEKIHPIDRSDPRRYGIEVYQPPLYYHLFDLGRFQEARQLIRQMLPGAPPELRVKLESMIRQVDARIGVK